MIRRKFFLGLMVFLYAVHSYAAPLNERRALENLARKADRYADMAQLDLNYYTDSYRKVRGEPLTRAKVGYYGSTISAQVAALSFTIMIGVATVPVGSFVGNSNAILIAPNLLTTLESKTDGRMPLITAYDPHGKAIARGEIDDPKAVREVMTYTFARIRELRGETTRLFMERLEEIDKHVNFLGKADLEYVNTLAGMFKELARQSRVERDYFRKLAKAIRAN